MEKDIKLNEEMKMSVIDAYASGLFDGEGYCGINACKRKNWNVVYKACCAIGNTDKDVLELLKKEYGGSIHKRYKQGYKDLYAWHLGGNPSVMSFLKRILPYLIIKKKVAETLLDFCLTCKDMRSELNKSDEFKSKELEKRKQIYEDIKRMNSIGTEATEEKRTIEQLRESFLYAYLAGVTDGEGYLGISKQKQNWNVYYSPCCQVGITSECIIQLLKAEFGGNIYKHPYSGTKIQYIWRIYNPDTILDFLRKLIPYLIVKKKQAEILYEFCIDYQDVRGKSNDTKAKELERREKLYNEIKKLNARGGEDE